MAALVYFKKLSEELDTVTYLFGEDPDTMSRNLMMDRMSRRAEPLDGHVDYTFLKASRKINAMYAEAHEWPERGMSAS